MGKRKLKSNIKANRKKTQSKNMQTQFFNQKTNIKNTQSAINPIAAEKTPTPSYCDDICSDSLNELNVAFIAEESKLLLSDSQSVVSEGLSISGISAIRSNGRGMSPLINFKLEEQFSGLQDWSVDHNISFAKSNLKRPNPSIDEEQNEEEIDNRCTKKKMNDRMKVVTIDSFTKVVEKNNNQSGYLLRSRVKAVIASQSSSNQELREMINDIQQQQMGVNQYKNKLRLK